MIHSALLGDATEVKTRKASGDLTIRSGVEDDSTTSTRFQETPSKHMWQPRRT